VSDYAVILWRHRDGRRLPFNHPDARAERMASLSSWDRQYDWPVTTEKPPMVTLNEIHTLLQSQFDDLRTMLANAPRMGGDTGIALGWALGSIEKAKALVGRDIDDSTASKPR
jgi:hypothetical protein